MPVQKETPDKRLIPEIFHFTFACIPMGAEASGLCVQPPILLHMLLIGAISGSQLCQYSAEKSVNRQCLRSLQLFLKLYISLYYSTDKPCPVTVADNKLEAKDVARVLDRLFFWVFLVLTITLVFTIVFASYILGIGLDNDVPLIGYGYKYQSNKLVTKQVR